jgi:hypothetical protein
VTEVIAAKADGEAAATAANANATAMAANAAKVALFVFICLSCSVQRTLPGWLMQSPCGVCYWATASSVLKGLVSTI